VSDEPRATRVAIVAESQRLRSALAAALGADEAFEVVGVGDAVSVPPESADVVLVARPTRAADLALTGEGYARSAALSPRERDVLALLADGLANKQIARRLGISPNTVKTHVQLLFEKLDASSRAEAVTTAVRRGLLLL
jgi:DNA-binding NarL/FixJ family response regulator